MMNSIKNMAISIAASFDRVVGQLENHQALVDSALRQMTDAAAHARVQHKRVQQDGRRMKHKIEELSEQRERWAERAIAIKDEDEARAIECLRRRNNVERELKHLESQIVDHAKMEKQLISDLREVDARIDELRRKKHELSAREYRSEALRSKQECNLGMMSELGDILERWETKVTRSELSTAASIDNFECEFEQEEEERDLRAELHALASISTKSE